MLSISIILCDIIYIEKCVITINFKIYEKIIIWAVAVLVVIMLGFWFFKSDKSADVVGATNTTDTTNSVSGTTNTNGQVSTNPAAIKSLLSDKGSYLCKYEQVDPKFRSTNLVYLSDGKMRAEFRTIAATSSTANLVVYDGRYLYAWKEGMSKGVITEPKTVAELATVIPDDLTSAAIYGNSPKNVSYDCHAWMKDAKLLMRPAGVTFN